MRFTVQFKHIKESVYICLAIHELLVQRILYIHVLPRVEVTFSKPYGDKYKKCINILYTVFDNEGKEQQPLRLYQDFMLIYFRHLLSSVFMSIL